MTCQSTSDTEYEENFNKNLAFDEMNFSIMSVFVNPRYF